MLPLSGVLFCSDLDGTLTGPDDTISVENVQAIRRFCALGGLFTIATGRFPDFIRPFTQAHPGIVTAPLVSMNGALIYDLDKSEALAVRPLRTDVVPVLELCRSLPDLRRIHMHQMSGSWTWEGDEASFARLKDGPILKIVVVWNSAASAEASQKEIVRCFGDSYDILRSWPLGVELLDPEGGKGNGMDFLRSALPGIRIVASAGDYENDLPMFERCDLSFAPANAMESVKLAATCTLREKNTDHFIAAALRCLEARLNG